MVNKRDHKLENKWYSAIKKMIHMNLFGIGIYTPAEAARITGAKTSEVSRWLFGYKDGAGGNHSPLWETQIPVDGELIEDKVIGFRDLMELRVIKAFTKHGVSIRVIRLALESATEMLGQYPFTANRFLTDGKNIFMEALDRDTVLTDLIKRQIVFEEIIRPSLYEGIEFSVSGAAMRWYPLKKNKAVILDPDLSFGKPVLSKFGISTELIAKSVEVEGDKKSVARQFDISISDVNAALKFEQQLLAA